MAGPDSWMPVYWADLWNDTRHLNAVEQCAYYNLLGSMWVEGGSLPNDNDRLQRMSRVTEKEWRSVTATVTAYFELRDGRFYQKRLGEEHAKAMKAYTARSEHMRNVNNKRKQSPPTVTVDGQSDVTHNSQSPNGEKSADADLGRKRPSKPPKTRLAPDWKPSCEERTYAHERGLTDAETDAEASEFREYFLSPDAAKPLKHDWTAAWQRWIRGNASRRLAQRTRSGKPGSNRQGAGGVVDVVARLKAKAAGESDVSAGGVHGGTAGFPTAASDPREAGIGAANGGPVLESDDAERMFRAARGNETDHDLPAGTGARSGSPVGAVCAEDAGLSGGRSAESADDPAEHEQVVAGMGGTERPVGPVQRPAPEIAASDDGLEIPGFLDVRHKRKA